MILMFRMIKHIFTDIGLIITKLKPNKEASVQAGYLTGILLYILVIPVIIFYLIFNRLPANNSELFGLWALLLILTIFILLVLEYLKRIYKEEKQLS